ncbi:MAG TPA: PadR family transcriptional regulator [Actinomycetota bacterium]
MPIHHAVLAVLAERESYGYELKASLERAMGPQWGDLNIGHLYQVLDRLVRDRFVTSRVVPQVDRPDRHVYRLTKRGREELERWLGEPFVRGSGYRDDFFFKLFAGSRLGAEQLRSVVEGQRAAYLSELAALGELQRRHRDDALVALLIRAAVLHTEANLRTAELAGEQVDRLVAEAREAAAPAAPRRRRVRARGKGRSAEQPRSAEPRLRRDRAG